MLVKACGNLCFRDTRFRALNVKKLVVPDGGCHRQVYQYTNFLTKTIYRGNDMEPVKLGIIGCGIAARELHWPALRQLGDKFTITAACNRTLSKAEEYAAMIGGTPVYTDYRKLLTSHDVEAVCIALPFHLNLEVTRAALEAGKHVFVEKPAASKLEEAEEMKALEKRHSDRVTMIAENFLVPTAL